MELKSLIYTSWASPSLSSEDVDSILDSARINNPLQGLSGILIFNGAHFMQILEGVEPSVDELVVRLILSFLLTPQTPVDLDDPAIARDFALRYIGPLLKHWTLRRGFPSGFRPPQKFEQAVFPVGPIGEEAVRQLQAALARTQREPMTAAHPVFGRLTHQQWTQFHLRHAELHLSFLHPEG